MLLNWLVRQGYSIFSSWYNTIHIALILGWSGFLRQVLFQLRYMQIWMLGRAWPVKPCKWLWQRDIRKRSFKKEAIIK